MKMTAKRWRRCEEIHIGAILMIAGIFIMEIDFKTFIPIKQRYREIDNKQIF